MNSETSVSMTSIASAVKRGHPGAWLVAIVGFSAAYVARLCAIPVRGAEWFVSYVGYAGVLVGGLFLNFIYGATLFKLATDKRFPVKSAYLAAAVSIAYVAVAHFAFLDLLESSTAGIGALVTPIFAIAIALLVQWMTRKWFHD